MSLDRLASDERVLAQVDRILNAINRKLCNSRITFKSTKSKKNKNSASAPTKISRRTTEDSEVAVEHAHQVREYYHTHVRNTVYKVDEGPETNSQADALVAQDFAKLRAYHTDIKAMLDYDICLGMGYYWMHFENGVEDGYARAFAPEKDNDTQKASSSSERTEALLDYIMRSIMTQSAQSNNNSGGDKVAIVSVKK